MTFKEVEQSLPNGFHDSAIRRIDADFLGPSISIAMDLHASVEGDINPELYRSGTLKVVCPYLFFLEPPDPSYPFVPRGAPVNATGFSVKPGENAKVDALLDRIPREATALVFFLDDWNSYLYLAGSSVEFSWDDSGSKDV
jgi:hypothetical protein